MPVSKLRRNLAQRVPGIPHVREAAGQLRDHEQLFRRGYACSVEITVNAYWREISCRRQIQDTAIAVRTLEHVTNGAGNGQRNLVQCGLEKCEHPLRRWIGPDSGDRLLKPLPRIVESMKDNMLKTSTRKLRNGTEGGRIELHISDDGQ